MLYYKCPKCKNILANKQIIYEKKLDSICKNINETEKNKKKRELVDELEVKRMCCRMRILSYIRLIDIIK